MLGDEVIKRVLSAAQKLGYRPNHAAATLRTRRSNMVGVVVPDITNPVFPPILLGIEDALQENGYVSVVANAGSALKQEIIIEQMLARQVDGLILATLHRRDPIIDLCLSSGTPLVAVNRGEDGARISSVVSDDAAGMALAVDHLVALGHRRIAHIAGPQSLTTGYLRKRGFIAAIAARRLVANVCPIIDNIAYTREAGGEACRALLDAHPMTTAIVAGNDLVALGCYDALKKLRRSCPRQISIVGHNDMPLMDLVSPPLTTVRIHHHQLGYQAARLVVGHIQRTQSGEMEIKLKPKLIVRGSTAAPADSERAASHRR